MAVRCRQRDDEGGPCAPHHNRTDHRTADRTVAARRLHRRGWHHELEGTVIENDRLTDGAEDGPADEVTSTEPTEDEGDAEPADTETDADAGGSSDLVDMSEAVPGSWPVGDAGTVTFAITDAALVLEDVAAADGWRADVDERSPDQIEVDFRRDNIEWEIEIELEDGGTILEIEIDQDIESADTGSYDIGDAGTFTFDVDNGALTLIDLAVENGWTVAQQEEEADEIELELVNGPREFDVDIELEGDGTIKIEIDYEVVGPVTD